MKSEISTGKNELDLGLGGISWWGFSPWESLCGESVLIVGAGDPRHVLRTLAEHLGGKVGLGCLYFEFI